MEQMSGKGPFTVEVEGGGNRSTEDLEKQGTPGLLSQTNYIGILCGLGQ
jgi:hypothetical protein